MLLVIQLLEDTRRVWRKNDSVFYLFLLGLTQIGSISPKNASQ